jgi:hypothetical protein
MMKYPVSGRLENYNPCNTNQSQEADIHAAHPHPQMTSFEPVLLFTGAHQWTVSTHSHPIFPISI